MKLREVMLDVAQAVDDVYSGTVTSASANYITDTGMGYPAEYFAGGTCFITSGSALGNVLEVQTNSETKITFTTTPTTTIAAANTFCVATKKFPKWQLRTALQWVLRQFKIPATTTVTITGGSVTLATGVSDVRQVVIDDVRNTHWIEIAGYLKFDDTTLTGTATIYYMKQHDDVTEATDIASSVKREYLIWSAAAWLWRRYIQNVKKDDPTALDMLNEAKVNEAAASAKATKYAPNSLPYDPHLGSY